MLEVQGAKSLTVQRNKYHEYYFKNDEFHCQIYSGRIRNLFYLPKCDFETYMFTWKNQILARYLRACIKYYGYKHPEMKNVHIEDKLSVDCGRSTDSQSMNGCAQYMLLTNLTTAFFKQSWFERYMKAVKHLDSYQEKNEYKLSILDDEITPDECVLRIMSRSYMSVEDIAAKYEHLLKSSKSIHEFFKCFTKRSRFNDGLPWIAGYMYHQIRPFYKDHSISIHPTSLSLSAMYDSVTIEELDYFDDYAFPHFEGTASEIVIQNEIISAMQFSLGDID